MPQKIAKELFYKGDYKGALELFKSDDCRYEAGLCTLLLGDEKEAECFWKKDKNPDIATSWGLIVLDLIKLKIKQRPSFFQVRAFLEVYLNLFIVNNHLRWAENIISASDIIVKSNPETYKFIARVLFANGYFNLVEKFIEESKNIFYFDPEAHFIQAQAYYLEKDYKKAYDSIIDTLTAAGEYYPALEFKKLIEEKLKSSRD